MTSFVQKLEAACQANRSLLCVGLDPDPRRMRAGAVYAFNKAIVDATRDLVCAYKPNGAFYEAFGLRGVMALWRTVRYIRELAQARSSLETQSGETYPAPVQPTQRQCLIVLALTP